MLRGRYLLEERLDHGRFGVVYRAFDLRGQRIGGQAPQVGVLVLPMELSRNARMLESVRDDCERLRTLQHPHIVRVLDFDAGGGDGASFAVLELVDGEPLRDVLDNLGEPLVRRDAIAVVRAVGAALEHAHEQGIVHGDVRPENVLVSSARNVKVLFAGTSLLRTAPFATEVRDDVFGLGCLVYELLTGGPPQGGYHGAGPGEPPAALERPKGLSRRQWAALRASLAPRDRRPRSVTALCASFRGAAGATRTLHSPAAPLPLERAAPAELGRRTSARADRAAPRRAPLLLLAVLAAAALYLNREQAADWASNAPALVEEALAPLDGLARQRSPAARDGAAPPNEPDAAVAPGSGAEVDDVRAETANEIVPDVRPEIAANPTGDAPNTSGGAAPARRDRDAALAAGEATEPARPSANPEANEPSRSPAVASAPPAPREQRAAGAPGARSGIGTARFARREATAFEGDGAVALEIRRSGGGAPLTVAWWTDDGTAVSGEDFAMFGARIETLGANELSRTIYVPITNDTIREDPELFYVNLRDGPEGGGARGTVTRIAVTIVDDDR